MVIDVNYYGNFQKLKLNVVISGYSHNNSHIVILSFAYFFVMSAIAWKKQFPFVYVFLQLF